MLDAILRADGEKPSRTRAAAWRRSRAVLLGCEGTDAPFAPHAPSAPRSTDVTAARRP
jgi:hypothetical protein